MKKFNFRGVLDGLRSSVSNTPKLDIEIEETLRDEDFKVTKSSRHGFPYGSCCLAYDPIQHLLALGTKNGGLRIFGRPGVDSHAQHSSQAEVIQIVFLINEGALVTACADDQIYLWSLRQKKPEIVHSLKFQRERISFCHLAFQSSWLYVGTRRGNVHVVNIENFVLSGYVINWNKAIELSQKTHPGQVSYLCDSPIDSNKLLIVFELGTIVLWDLKSKLAEARFQCIDTITSACWNHDGKQFIVSHKNGSLTIWNPKSPQKPISSTIPHARLKKEKEYKMIGKIAWESCKSGDDFTIFSGGVLEDMSTLTVTHGKNTTVLEMEYPIISFVPIRNSPWPHDFQDPHCVVVLLKQYLVVVDLITPGYPIFENPYPMDIHESPVTTCFYLANCPGDLIPALYAVGCKQKKGNFSDREWPIKGGEWGTSVVSYPEIVITGHADGSVKFWDASAANLQMLYKLKTSRLFDRTKLASPEPDEDPFAVQHVKLCTDTRQLAIAGMYHVTLFKFNKNDAIVECNSIEVTLMFEMFDNLDSPDMDREGASSTSSLPSGSCSSYGSDKPLAGEAVTCVRPRSLPRKWSMGYQPLVCALLCWHGADPPSAITSLALNSSYGLVAFGNDYGLAIIDVIQNIVILNLCSPDLYGSMDPYSRAPRSPKNKLNSTQNSQTNIDDKSTIDQCEHSETSSSLYGQFLVPTNDNNNKQYKENHNNLCANANAPTRIEYKDKDDINNVAKTIVTDMDPIAPPRSNHNSMIRRLSKKVAHSLHPNSATTCTSNQKTSYEPCFDYVDLMSQTTTDSSNAGLRSTTYRLYADIGMCNCIVNPLLTLYLNYRMFGNKANHFTK